MNGKLKSYIGLAQRAGGVIYGEDAMSEKKRAIKLILINSEASDKYKTRIKSKFADKPHFETHDLTEMLHRDNVKAIAISNDALAEAIIDLLRCING